MLAYKRIVTVLDIVLLTSLCALVAGCKSDPGSVVPFEQVNRITIPYSAAPGFLYGHPGLEASINGVTGRFMIDTGTVEPILSRQAVRLCGLNLTPRFGKWWNGERAAPMEVATNVTVWLAPGFPIHWHEVVVFSWEDETDTNFFGLLDYGTLQAAHAVINTRDRTVTFGR